MGSRVKFLQDQYELLQQAITEEVANATVYSIYKGLQLDACGQIFIVKNNITAALPTIASVSRVPDEALT